mmetsp:Transcript_524/g.1674  ORF Transcript_524/g.1674 Transcript_524/m.1674 type:complete len:243 (+) Transcript_524:149-877(+)
MYSTGGSNCYWCCARATPHTKRQSGQHERFCHTHHPARLPRGQGLRLGRAVTGVRPPRFLGTAVRPCPQAHSVAAQESRSMILMSDSPPGPPIFTMPSSLSMPMSWPTLPLLSPRRMMTRSRLAGRTTSRSPRVALTFLTSSDSITSYVPSEFTSTTTPRLPSWPAVLSVTSTRSGSTSCEALPPAAAKPVASDAAALAAHEEAAERPPGLAGRIDPKLSPPATKGDSPMPPIDIDPPPAPP